jgi:hypothetical protein
MRLSATTAKWIALALLGLAIAAGVAVAASNLVSRQIGIASESVSAGDDLAPAVESAARQVEGDGSRNTAPEGNPEADDDDGAVSNGESEDTGGGTGVSADELEDRIDEEEDARDEAEDAAEDRADELEDLADDNSGQGSDD